MKKIISIAVVLIFLLFPSVCFAESVDTDKIYEQKLQELGLSDTIDDLPNQTKEQLENINIEDPLVMANFFEPENIFDILKDFLKNNIKTPLKYGALLLSVLLIGAAFGNFYEKNKLLDYSVTVSLVATSIIPVLNIVTVCANTLKSSGAFMLSFVPIYASVLASSGKPITAGGFSAIMLLAVQILTSVCSFLIVPLSGMQLSLGIGGSLSGEIKWQSVSNAIKKFSLFSLSAVSTVFLAVLSIQTVIKSPADDLYSKSAKLILNTAVPYVGSVLGETLNTVRGCMSLLKSSVLIYGVCAVLFTTMPIIIELLCWRGVLCVCGSIAEVLSVDGTKGLLTATDSAVALVLGITLIIPAMFIISMTLVLVI